MITSDVSSPLYLTSTLEEGSSMISNQPIVGSNIVRHMESKIVLHLSLSMQGSIRSTHTLLCGIVLAILGGKRSYLCLIFLLC